MRLKRKAMRRILDADQIQQLHGAVRRLLSGDLLLLSDRLHDLLADGDRRVERGERILKHHGAVSAADMPHLPLGTVRDILAADRHAAALDEGILRQQVHDRLAQHGLSAAGLADQTEDFSCVYSKIHAANGLHLALRRAEAHRQILQLQNRFRHSNTSFSGRQPCV